MRLPIRLPPHLILQEVAASNPHAYTDTLRMACH
jgi:hypothetical protein